MGCGTCFYTVFLRLIQWNRLQSILSALPLTILIFEIYIFTFIIHQKMVFSLRVYWYSQQLYNSALLHKLDSSIYLNFRTRVFPKKSLFFSKLTFVISLLTYKKYTKSVLFAHYKHNVAYFWCNIIDILMTNISVYK